MKLIREFNKLGKNDAAIAGGKGASLGEMTQAGIPVPPGYVILSNSFEIFIEKTDLNIEIDSILHKVNHEDINTVENASEEIKALILGAEMPQDIGKEIKRNFSKLGAKYVAVRSSATAEDSSSAAWAGQLESYLNTTESTLLENVKKCWASLFTPRAIFYRFEKGLHDTKISVAVVIQKMIESELSGIAFSVHPVTQDYNQLIIEAGYGLGEAIVSGQITPDSYVIEKSPRRIIDRNIAEQERGMYKVQAGGNEWRNIEAIKGSQQKLTDKQIEELSEIILRIESHYKFPCDIEWAYEKGKFYIVQSRPITTLTSQTPKEETKKKSNIGNHDNYQRLFQWKGGGLPFLISDIFMDHYKSLRGLVILTDKTWTNYLPKEIIKETLKDGLKRISNTKEFESYEREFETYKKRCTDFFANIKKQEITKKDLEKALEFLTTLFFYYSKTEFFYTDKAYEYSKKDKTTKKNLEKFDKIKNEGRAYLNKVFLEDNSYISIILRLLKNKFKVDLDELNWYSKEELVSLFDNKKVPKEDIEQRKFAFIMQGINGKNVTFQGEEAKNIANEWVTHSQKEGLTELKGIIANKGKAKGKAKVINNSYEDFHKINDLINEMNKGDILVAETTSPEIMAACKKAAAIITNQGGMLSHAAIVSRELGIPCIVGIEFAVDTIKDGDIVEVDADNGIVKILSNNQNKSVQTFEKVYTRETGLLAQETWNKAFERDFYGNKNPYIPAMVNYVNDGVIELWENEKALQWFKDQLLKKNLEDKNFLDKSIKKYLSDAEKLRKIAKKGPVRSIKELKELISWLEESVHTFCVYYFTAYDERNPESLRKKALKVREKDDFYDTMYRITRDSLEFLYPYTKGLTISIISKELSPPPSKEALEKRFKHSVMAGHGNIENIALESFAAKNQQFNFIFEKAEESNQLSGQSAMKGFVKGKIKVLKRRDQIKEFKEGEILVSPMTTPDFLPAIKRASAIITDEGGVTCHAAIVARELRKPCVIGTKFATQLLKDGDLVEVNADKGTVKILSKNQKTNKQTFEKTFSRDFCMTALEIAVNSENRDDKPWLDGSNPHKPYLIVDRSNGTCNMWFNKQGLEYVKKTLAKKSKSKSFLDKVETKVREGIKFIRPLYENPKALDRKNLLKFIDEFLEAYPWIEAMWWIKSLDAKEWGIKNERIVKLREETETLSAGTEIVIRKSLEKLSPKLGLLSSMIRLEEFRSDKIPSKDVLQKRLNGFVLIPNNLMIKSIEQVAKDNNFHLEIEKIDNNTKELKGQVANKGKAQGIVCKVMGHADFGKIKQGQILVSPMTMVDFLPEMKKAAAFITDEGGLTSHAAIVARELKKPCIVGTKFATQILNDGMKVEVDANIGIIRILK